MRLVTWNACKGQFANKAHFLDHLHADVAVLQEIAKPKMPIPNVLWFGLAEVQRPSSTLGGCGVRGARIALPCIDPDEVLRLLPSVRVSQ